MRRSRLIYEFGPYHLDLSECRLLRGGEEITLRPKLFDLLAVLIEHSGQMLEKDELIHFVWPDTEVEDNNLTVSINALRRALGEDQYIETVSRRGYRFSAVVKVLAADGYVTATTRPAPEDPDPPGGALPLHSNFYIERETDAEFNQALARNDSIVLVKGARQVGKTSLLARGMQHMREAGAAVVLTDLQHLTASSLENVEKLLLTLAELIADQLELGIVPNRDWNSFLSPSSNFERFLRRAVLGRLPTSLVWGLDEVDRLFSCDYASEVFGLFRSWHNLRALDPAGPWQRLTLAFAYATEAHLFITDLNQSPFNVGTRLTLEDFTPDQVAELNSRYGGPLRTQEELTQFHNLIGGHPYLTQRGLYEMVKRKSDLPAVQEHAVEDEGVFGDHLRRMLISLERDPVLREALRKLLYGEEELSRSHFYRLRSAGVLSGSSPQDARPRCELYRRYLTEHLL
ncbi:MAG TPA: AAA-like domain-containing protein [Blastocatellia bacterium]|nr:AAA-like domain-containing protein [Blastocatellia bacterium]